jgi:tetratricopeptide (TPR) repeat protein
VTAEEGVVIDLGAIREEALPEVARPEISVQSIGPNAYRAAIPGGMSLPEAMASAAGQIGEIAPDQTYQFDFGTQGRFELSGASVETLRQRGPEAISTTQGLFRLGENYIVGGVDETGNRVLVDMGRDIHANTFHALSQAGKEKIVISKTGAFLVGDNAEIGSEVTLARGAVVWNSRIFKGNVASGAVIRNSVVKEARNVGGGSRIESVKADILDVGQESWVQEVQKPELSVGFGQFVKTNFDQRKAIPETKAISDLIQGVKPGAEFREQVQGKQAGRIRGLLTKLKELITQQGRRAKEAREAFTKDLQLDLGMNLGTLFAEKNVPGELDLLSRIASENGIGTVYEGTVDEESIGIPLADAIRESVEKNDVGGSVDLLLHVAGKLLENDEIDAASKLVDAAMRLNYKNTLIHQFSGEVQLIQGQRNKLQGNKDQARDAFLKAQKAFKNSISLGPKNIEAMMGQAEVSLALGNSKEGLELLKKANEIEHDSSVEVRRLLLVADAQLAIGLIEEAEKTLAQTQGIDQEITLSPQRSEIAEKKGEKLLRERNLPEAIKAYEEMAKQLELTGNEEAYRGKLEALSQQPMLRTWAGETLAKWYENRIKLGKAALVDHFRLAKLYEQMGNMNQAGTQYEALVSNAKTEGQKRVTQRKLDQLRERERVLRAPTDVGNALRELTQALPEKKSLVEEYSRKFVVLRNLIGALRRTNVQTRQQLLARYPITPEMKGRLLEVSGSPDQPPLTLDVFHDLLIRFEPKFSPIDNLVNAGLLDPKMPIQPSEGAVPDRLSEPASSIEHARST